MSDKRVIIIFAILFSFLILGIYQLIATRNILRSVKTLIHVTINKMCKTDFLKKFQSPFVS